MHARILCLNVGIQWRLKQIESKGGGATLIRNPDNQKQKAILMIMSNFAKKWGGGGAKPNLNEWIFLLKIEYLLLRKRRIYDVLCKKIIHGFRLTEHTCSWKWTSLMHHIYLILYKKKSLRVTSIINIQMYKQPGSTCII